MDGSVFRIMDLPYEIRAHILSFLLPDRKIIEVEQSLVTAPPWRNSDPQHWYPEADTVFWPRYDGDRCHTQILRANRQLYQEGFDYLYKQRAYKINIYGFGFEFLREGTQLDVLPPFPYPMVQEFIIYIDAGHGLPEMGHRLRTNLLRLCGLLKHHQIRFKKLTIEFASSRRWDKAWDAEKESGLYLPETVYSFSMFHEAVYQDNQELYARDWGFSSTFAWMITPIALLPTVGECTIKLPLELRGDPKFVDLAKWYEEGIDGRADFAEDPEFVANVIKEDQKEWELPRYHYSNYVCPF